MRLAAARVACVVAWSAVAAAAPVAGTEMESPRGDDTIDCKAVLPDVVAARFGLAHVAREPHVYSQPACRRPGDEHRCWINDVTCKLDGKAGGVQISYWCDSLQSADDLDRSAIVTNEFMHEQQHTDDDYQRRSGLGRRAWVSAKEGDVLMLSSARDCRVQIDHDEPGSARERLAFAHAVDRGLARIRPAKRK